MALNRLLLIGCSERKLRAPETPIPAIERYDGVLFRVLRKNPTPVSIFIVSAEFGLIPSDTLIPFYDRRMSTRRATELRPHISAALSSVLQTDWDDIFVSLGKTYAIALGSSLNHTGAVMGSGGIGRRAAQLKRWLLQ